MSTLPQYLPVMGSLIWAVLIFASLMTCPPLSRLGIFPTSPLSELCTCSSICSDRDKDKLEIAKIVRRTESVNEKRVEQCGIAARKGNQLLGMIKGNITYREKNVIIPLYKSIVRPHLQYCIQAWRLHLKKDIDKLEQSNKVSMLSYEDRVQQCKLTTLETKRVRGDQIIL